MSSINKVRKLRILYFSRKNKEIKKLKKMVKNFLALNPHLYILLTLLVIYVTSFSSLGLGCRKQLGKWSEMSILNINVLKSVFTNKFVKI